MKYAVSIIIVALCIGISNSMAQNPYKAQGVHVEPLTLSKGKYNEFFTNDTLVQIGSVLFNTNTNKVVKYLEPDSSGIPMPEPGTSSRFLSIDPLAAKYPSISPYNYALSNPINFKDPDGRAAVKCPPCGPILISPDVGIPLLKGASALLFSFANAVSDEAGRGSSTDGYDFDFDAEENRLMDEAFGDASPYVEGGVVLGTVLSGKPQAGLKKGAKKMSMKSKVLDDLPAIDATGKLHGVLPNFDDLKGLSVDELTKFRDDLSKSIQQRIKSTTLKGPNATILQNKKHGERQFEEQDLLNKLNKFLEDQ